MSRSSLARPRPAANLLQTLGGERATDPAERRKLVHQLQHRLLDQAYYMPGLWWTRRVVHLAKVKNYVAPPSHYTNQKLQDVWLSED